MRRSIRSATGLFSIASVNEKFENQKKSAGWPSSQKEDRRGSDGRPGPLRATRLPSWPDPPDSNFQARTLTERTETV